MRHTSPYKILALLLLASVCFGQGFILTPPPYWYVVAPPGTLVARPATCTPDFHVYVCNGAGCTTNGEYHYCTALNTWTVASGTAFVGGSGTINTLPKFTAATILGDSVFKDDGTIATITQNGVIPFTSVAAGAVVNTLYLSTGKVGMGGIPSVKLHVGVGASTFNYAGVNVTTVASIEGSNAFGTALSILGKAVGANAAASSALYLGNENGEALGGMQYTWATAILGLRAGGAMRATLDQNGVFAATQHVWANAAEGTCDAAAANRGRVTMVQGAAGVADTFRVCSKDAADAYAFRALY